MDGNHLRGHNVADTWFAYSTHGSFKCRLLFGFVKHHRVNLLRI
jgi:hypothetical protein